MVGELDIVQQEIASLKRPIHAIHKALTHTNAHAIIIVIASNITTVVYAVFNVDIAHIC
ncbi:hypothetical protein AYI69_g6568, partial [Smittium culicis]